MSGAGGERAVEDEKGCLSTTNKLKNHLITLRNDEVLQLLKFYSLQISPFTLQRGEKWMSENIKAGDLKEMLIGAEGCRDSVPPPDNLANEEQEHQKDLS